MDPSNSGHYVTVGYGKDTIITNGYLSILLPADSANGASPDLKNDIIIFMGHNVAINGAKPGNCYDPQTKQPIDKQQFGTTDQNSAPSFQYIYDEITYSAHFRTGSTMTINGPFRRGNFGINFDPPILKALPSDRVRKLNKPLLLAETLKLPKKPKASASQPG